MENEPQTSGCKRWTDANFCCRTDGLLSVVNAGGDADTNASVACAIGTMRFKE